MKIAILGNSPLNIGIACAAELAAMGHEVHVALSALPGAVEIAGQGRWPLHPGTAKSALHDADFAVIDIPPPDLLAVLEPHLADLSRVPVVHVNSHGYWPALRLGTAMLRAGLRGFCITDAGAPTHAAGFDGAVVTPHARRTGLRFAAFPQRRIAEAMPLLRLLAPDGQAAASPIASGLDGINLMVHPSLALVNLGWFDRAAVAGERVAFYGAGNTQSAAALAEALDAERGAICAAWGVPHRSLPETIRALYGAAGEGVLETVRNCPFYAGLAPQEPMLWRRWLAVDVPFALRPAAALAQAVGVAAPLHAGLAAIFDAVLGGSGPALDLAALGLAGLSPSHAKAYAHEGIVP
jgi:opine dehydrogenase